MTTLTLNPMNMLSMTTPRSFLKKTFFAAVVTLSFASLSSAASAADAFTAGKDYKVLSNPGPVDKPGQIEVREFFWYGCPHCFRLDPFVQQWLKTKPTDVNFVRTPAALNPVWEQNARGFYAVDMLGQTEKVHSALFNAIQVKEQRLFDQASLASFYASQGIDANKFNGLYNSFAVTGKVAQSKKLAIQYQLEGVPAIVVNGKYVVQGEDGKVLEIVSYLVNKERTAKK